MTFTLSAKSKYHLTFKMMNFRISSKTNKKFVLTIDKIIGNSEHSIKNVYKSKLWEIPNWGFTYQVFYIKTRGPGATLLIWVTKAITNQKRFDHLYSIKYKISTQFLITSPLKGTWINLKALSLRMFCAKFCWNCPVVLEMKMKSVW